MIFAPQPRWLDRERWDTKRGKALDSHSSLRELVMQLATFLRSRELFLELRVLTP
jgi:hypothetical protein